MPLNIEDRDAPPIQGSVLMQLGFRPFFILAGLSAVALLGIWLLLYTGKLSGSSYFANPVLWHSHEMLFGYSMAVIAGFLLTAVQNWTGVKTLRGGLLAGLAVVWLAGRIAILLDAWIAAWLIALIDLAFIPLLVIAVSQPLLKVRQYKNFIFIGLLLLMAVANLLVHLEALSGVEGGVSGTRLMYYLVMLLIVVMGGRVIPFFTERGIGDIRLKTYPWIEVMAAISVVVYAVWDVLLSGHAQPAIPGIALAAAALVFQLLRSWSWYHPGIWRVPMVWVLQLGYFWLSISFVLKLLAHLGWVAEPLALHAFTIGVLGVITLGMMSRVAQGHTGRTVMASKLAALAFGLLLVAAVVRVGGGLLLSELYIYSVIISGLLWIGAFILFCVEYIPLLLQPRIDGRPG